MSLENVAAKVSTSTSKTSHQSSSSETKNTQETAPPPSTTTTKTATVADNENKDESTKASTISRGRAEVVTSSLASEVPTPPPSDPSTSPTPKKTEEFQSLPKTESQGSSKTAATTTTTTDDDAKTSNNNNVKMMIEKLCQTSDSIGDVSGLFQSGNSHMLLAKYFTSNNSSGNENNAGGLGGGSFPTFDSQDSFAALAKMMESQRGGDSGNGRGSDSDNKTADDENNATKSVKDGSGEAVTPLPPPPPLSSDVSSATFASIPPHVLANIFNSLTSTMQQQHQQSSSNANDAAVNKNSDDEKDKNDEAAETETLPPEIGDKNTSELFKSAMSQIMGTLGAASNSNSGSSGGNIIDLFSSRDWAPPQFKDEGVDVRKVFTSEFASSSATRRLSTASAATAAAAAAVASKFAAAADGNKKTTKTTGGTTTIATTNADKWYSQILPSAVSAATPCPLEAASALTLLNPPSMGAPDKPSSAANAEKQSQPGTATNRAAGVTDGATATTTTTSTKKTPTRTRKRKNYEPDEKVYVEPTEEDVLLGRGGRTNHHEGNKRYLRAKEDIQQRYMSADKNEKTAISQELVDVVHNWGGRFLKLDDEKEGSSNNKNNSGGSRWYVVHAIVARKKASQTLRETNTPEARALKRAKYNPK